MAIQGANIPTARPDDFEVGAVQEQNMAAIAVGAYMDAYNKAQDQTYQRQIKEAQLKQYNFQQEVIAPIKRQQEQEKLELLKLKATEATAESKRKAEAYRAKSAQIVTDVAADDGAEQIHLSTISFYADLKEPSAEAADAYKGLQKVYDSLPDKSPRKAMIGTSLASMKSSPVVARSLQMSDLLDAQAKHSEPLGVPPEVETEINRLYPQNASEQDPKKLNAQTEKRQDAAEKWRKSQAAKIGNTETSKAKELSPSSLARIATSDNVPPELKIKAQSSLSDMMNRPSLFPQDGKSGINPKPPISEEKRKTGASYFD